MRSTIPNVEKLCCRCKAKKRYSTGSYCKECHTEWSRYYRNRKCRRCGREDNEKLSKREGFCAGCQGEWDLLKAEFMRRGEGSGEV